MCCISWIQKAEAVHDKALANMNDMYMYVHVDSSQSVKLQPIPNHPIWDLHNILHNKSIFWGKFGRNLGRLSYEILLSIFWLFSFSMFGVNAQSCQTKCALQKGTSSYKIVTSIWETCETLVIAGSNVHVCQKQCRSACFSRRTLNMNAKIKYTNYRSMLCSRLLLVSFGHQTCFTPFCRSLKRFAFNFEIKDSWYI